MYFQYADVHQFRMLIKSNLFQKDISQKEIFKKM